MHDRERYQKLIEAILCLGDSSNPEFWQSLSALKQDDNESSSLLKNIEASVNEPLAMADIVEVLSQIHFVLSDGAAIVVALIGDMSFESSFSGFAASDLSYDECISEGLTVLWEQSK